MKPKNFLIIFFSLLSFKEAIAICEGPLIPECPQTTVTTTITSMPTIIVRWCGMQHFVAGAFLIVRFLLHCVLFWAATIGIILGGMNILLAKGDPKLIEQGKQILLYSIQGMIVALLAGPIIKLILKVLVRQEYWPF